MSYPHPGRPPIDITPLVEYIKTMKSPTASLARKAFPREWAAARKSGRIRTYHPGYRGAWMLVEVLDNPMTREERWAKLNTLRAVIPTLEEPFTRDMVLQALPASANITDKDVLKILSYMNRQGEIMLIDENWYSQGIMAGTVTRGRKKSPHPFRNLLKALEDGPILSPKLSQEFTHAKVNQAREAGLIEKFYDPATGRPKYRLTTSAYSHPDFTA